MNDHSIKNPKSYLQHKLLMLWPLNFSRDHPFIKMNHFEGFLNQSKIEENGT